MIKSIVFLEISEQGIYVESKSVPYSEDDFIAESKKRNEKRNANNPAHGEAGHVHDENCGHNH